MLRNYSSLAEAVPRRLQAAGNFDLGRIKSHLIEKAKITWELRKKIFSQRVDLNTNRLAELGGAQVQRRKHNSKKATHESNPSLPVSGSKMITSQKSPT